MSPNRGRLLRVLTFVSAFVGLLLLSTTRAEDEEPTPKKPVKKIIVPEDEPAGIAGLAIPDLVRASTAAKDPVLKGLFQTFSVPFDRISDNRGNSIRVLPLPLVYGKDKFPEPFGASVLDNANKPSDTVSLSRAYIKTIEPFEQLAVNAVDTLLNPPKSVTADRIPPLNERLVACERVLTQVMFFHETAAEQRKRTGKSWEPYKTKLDDKLTEVRLKLVEQTAKDKQWAKLSEMVERFAARYKSQPKVLQQMYSARLQEADELLQSVKLQDLERVRELILDYEVRFPNDPTELSRKVRAGLSARARAYIADAEKLMATNPTEARNILRTIESFDATDDERLRKLQQQLKAGYAVLIVGTRRIPERMSPATARWESEKQALDLLFEGLLEPTPDDKLGQTYRPGLIVGKPQTSALAREILLTDRATWHSQEAGSFDTADVLSSFKLMKEKRSLVHGDLVEWFDETGLDPADPARIKLRFKTGHPDVRDLLSMKMLPARWLESKQKAVDDLGFATRPFGTGPFRFVPPVKAPEQGQPPPEVVFTANPNYARRNGKFGQPQIKEVRFVPMVSITDPLAEVKGERLHILTEVPTREIERYTGLTQATVVTPATNRRIHVLAINHKVPALQHLDARKAINMAIDREGILNDVYRAAGKNYHKALSGPFPADSWLTPKPNGVAGVLYNKDVAAARLALTRNNAKLKILYPNDDALAREACERIKKCIEEVGSPSSAVLTIELDPVSPKDLFHRVYQEQRYDLAYVSHEYSSDWSAHELVGLLDPTAAGPGGRNAWSYLVKETNPSTDDERFSKLLSDLKVSRDPERVKALSAEVHKRFNEQVPFVPLWQIDNHMVISNKLKLFVEGRAEVLPGKYLQPSSLFNTIAKWRLD